ncbi:hypothetical protein ILYODFUR_032664 [Ilyodon furcidens]|uniref:Uncharacterized protein n=1 Tax=Ilyodon furcidens TaxID=33524 RepID=A0ABV0T5H6_9TELE
MHASIITCSLHYEASFSFQLRTSRFDLQFFPVTSRSAGWSHTANSLSCFFSFPLRTLLPLSPTSLSPSCQPAATILKFILLADSISMETSRNHGNCSNRAKLFQNCFTRSPHSASPLPRVIFTPSFLHFSLPALKRTHYTCGITLICTVSV